MTLRRTNPGRHGNNSARGLLLLAIGNPEGFAYFGADAQAYLTSLTPLLGFLVVYGGEVAITQSPVRGGASFLAYLICLLAPPVLAEPLCRRWGRTGAWCLYANILNWTQILQVAIAMVAAIVLVLAGVPIRPAAGAAGLAVLAYAAWMQWFTARCALDLTRWQTVKLLLVTQIGTGILVAVPTLLGPDFKP